MIPRLSLVAFAILLAGPAVYGQQYGQWSWEAMARAGHRSYRNTLNGVPTNLYQQRELQFFAGVNGFIVHPAIAAFSAGIDTTVNRYSSGSSIDSKAIGYRLHLMVLPESFFPIQLYAARQNYGYEDRPDGDESLLYAIPDHGTSYGGRVRFRGGVLRGLEASFDRAGVDVVGTQPGRETSNRDMLDWSRGSAAVQQHYRLERQVRSFARSGYVLSDLLARAEEQGTFGRWHWNAYGNALRREFSAGETRTPAITIGRLASVLTSENHERPAWTFSAESNYAGGANDTLTSHSLAARYMRPQRHGFQWSPVAGYMIQNGDQARIQAPSAGVSAAYVRNTGTFDLSSSSAVAVMRLSSSRQDAIPSQTRLSYSGGVSAGHTGIVTERLDAGFSRNQLRTSSTLDEEPGFGAFGSAGTENTRQARLTLSGRAGGFTANAYSDWSDRESELTLPGRAFQTTTLLHTLQIGSRRLSVTASSGNTDVRTDRTETIRFSGIGLSASPFSFLSLSSTYRRDRRSARLEPPIDGNRLEAGASIRVGAFYLNPLAFWMTERVDQGDERTNRGFTMSISRHFGGFLPVVSAPRRRGTIQ